METVWVVIDSRDPEPTKMSDVIMGPEDVWPPKAKPIAFANIAAAREYRDLLDQRNPRAPGRSFFEVVELDVLHVVPTPR